MANNFEPAESEELPMFQSGGFVKETGYIMPALGSEAAIRSAQAKTHCVVNYHFPVEVVIVGGLSEEDYRTFEARFCRNFGNAWNWIT